MKTNTAITVGAAIAALYWFRTQASRQPIATVTTSEGFDLSPYGGPITYPQGIKDFAQAIARAEGFFTRGSIPQRAHNPGDLKLPNTPTIGGGITVFPNDAAGWTALYKQLYRILIGQSDWYSLDMSIADMAHTWTTTQADAWGANVAHFLSVDPDVKLWEVLA